MPTVERLERIVGLMHMQSCAMIHHTHACARHSMRQMRSVIKRHPFGTLRPNERARVRLADEAIDVDVGRQASERDSSVAKWVEEGFGKLKKATVEEREEPRHWD
uniref:Uncharacterized protein n=1 Tax=Haptolina brevifila TaxID=156173 RepID=A0A7S2HLC9_9EUKA